MEGLETLHTFLVEARQCGLNKLELIKTRHGIEAIDMILQEILGMEVVLSPGNTLEEVGKLLEPCRECGMLKVLMVDDNQQTDALLKI